METLFSFLLAAIVTIYFVRRYMRSLTASQALSPAAGRSTRNAPDALQVPCPRCGNSIVKGVPFCSQCGAALALWTVHQAAVQDGIANQGTQGKPKPVINIALCIGCGSCVDACPESGTLELVGGKSMLIHPDGCLGHSSCIRACPTQAIQLSFGGMLQTIRVPDIKENFESNVPGLFVIGEMGGMGLIKTAINEGKLVIDHLRNRLGDPSSAVAAHPEASGNGGAAGTKTGTVYDVAIVGAGPGGLSASLTAHQYGLNYITLEQGAIASTIKQYPRQKFLMAEPLSMPLYGNLYIADGSKEALLAVWETIIANTGVRIRTDEKVESVRRENGEFVVQTAQARYLARNVVLAMGKRGTPRRLDVPGEELSKVTYHLIEADTYDNRDVLVVGGGDSAIEAAMALSKAVKNRVTLSYRGADFKRARERNQALLEEAERQGRIRILRESRVLEIRCESVQLQIPAGLTDFSNDYVFILIGGESPEEFLTKTGVRVVEKALMHN